MIIRRTYQQKDCTCVTYCKWLWRQACASVQSRQSLHKVKAGVLLPKRAHCRMSRLHFDFNFKPNIIHRSENRACFKQVCIYPLTKVNLGLIVGDWTRVILFVGQCHLLGCRCIGLLFSECHSKCASETSIYSFCVGVLLPSSTETCIF